MLSLIVASLLSATPDAPPVCPSGEEKPNVEKLVTFTEKVLSGKTTVGTMKMTIKTPTFTRALKMKMWSKGEDYALIRVIEGGPREVGMMTLKREKQLWNYLPKAGRVMKLPSGMLGDSWMGSDFTNDDLVKGNSMSKDFTSSVESIDGKTWKVTLIPTKDAAVVWGKIEMTVDKATCLPLMQSFYDEENKLARKMEFSGIKKVGWRNFPAKMTVTPGDSGRQTIVEYEEIEFDTPIPDDTFSLHRLQQGR